MSVVPSSVYCGSVVIEQYHSVKAASFSPLQLLSQQGFLQGLMAFPKDTINEEMVELLAPYQDMEDYTFATACKVCGDVAGLLSWTRAMVVFYGINKEVLPLKVKQTFAV